MRIEIELHEARAEDGESVRVRIVREIREAQGSTEATVSLVRDHDSGVELREIDGGDAYQDVRGRRYRLVRRLA